jgi:hypothetical protein
MIVEQVDSDCQLFKVSKNETYGFGRFSVLSSRFSALSLRVRAMTSLGISTSQSLTDSVKRRDVGCLHNLFISIVF